MKFKILLLLCFIYFKIPFVKAQDSTEKISEHLIATTYIEATSYRIGRQLCYAYTYHSPNGNGQVPLSGALSGVSGDGDLESYYLQYLLSSEEYRIGVSQWLSIELEALQDALFSLSRPDSSAIQSLIKADGFEDAIRICAEESHLNYEDLYQRIQSDILAVNRWGQIEGFLLQSIALVSGTTIILKGLIKGVNITVTRGSAFLQNFIQKRWPEVYQSILDSRIIRALQYRHDFFQRLREVRWLSIALGTTAVSVTLINKGDSAYYQIFQEYQATIQRGEQVTEEIKVAMEKVRSDFELVFWLRRWSAYNLMIDSLQSETISTDEYDAIAKEFLDKSLDSNIEENIEPVHINKDELASYLARCDQRITILNAFCSMLNLYVVDYAFVKARVLEFEKPKLNLVLELFNFRKRILEQEYANGDIRKGIPLRLIEMSENDHNFRCNFQDQPYYPLCRLHYLLVLKDSRNLTSSEDTELKQLEAELLFL